jgi:hypothetical protein
MLDKKHPNTLISISNLANILSDQVRYEQIRKNTSINTFSIPLNSLNILVFMK